MEPGAPGGAGIPSAPAALWPRRGRTDPLRDLFAPALGDPAPGPRPYGTVGAGIPAAPAS
ncbi:hypothetical protein GCM10010341_11730 [Streptomyces noursei]|nr:hypothetical protein GCM10010341_11730 [Streptomyces noursei]